MDTKKLIHQTYVKALRAMKRKSLPLTKDLQKVNSSISMAKIRHHYGNLTTLQELVYQTHADLFPETYVLGEDFKTDYRAQILEDYAKFREGIPHTPSTQELKEVGLYDRIRTHFGNISTIENELRDTKPEVFNDVELDKVLSPRQVKKFKAALRGKKRFIVHAVVTGDDVDALDLQASKTFSKYWDAPILLVVCSDPAKAKSSRRKFLVDKALLDDPDVHFVNEKTALNNNLHIATTKISAKQIDPAWGLDVLGQQDGSFIYASPQQRMEVVSVANDKFAHIIFTPGCITKPHYTAARYMSERTAELADATHIMGGLIVEIKNSEKYFVRNFEFASDGSFCDLDKKYNPDGTIEDTRMLALDPGDWHNGITCPKVKLATYDMIERLKPKYLFLDDYFDGRTVNHHEESNILMRALRAEKGDDDLFTELEELALQSDEFVRRMKYGKGDQGELIVIPSNHDDFLLRYIAAGDYSKTPKNLRCLSRLVDAALDHCDPKVMGDSPLKVGHDWYAKPETIKHMTWIREDEDCIRGGVNRVHGHRGPGGSRNPSIKTMSRNYGPLNFGHKHKPGRWRHVYLKGTSTPLRIGYNKGPGTWLNAHIGQHLNGKRQMLLIFDGEYCL